MKTNETSSEALRELMQGAQQPEPEVVKPGLTVAQMTALFFDKNALHEPKYRLWQLNSRGGRYYYTFSPTTGEAVFFPSVTTILRKVMPENKFLTDWKLSKGKEAAEEYTLERANYGSFIHGQLASLAALRRYNLDGVRDALADYVTRNNLAYGFIDAHEEEAKADIKAFARWMWEYDVKPYAIEVSLFSEVGYAGMIDLVCNLRTVSRSDEAAARAKYGADEKKLAAIEAKAAERIDAIVDFKTGKKGFYDEYAIQLELYRRMWNENFPDVPIERIFNIAPKDWTKTVKKVPSFSFEEQTSNPVLRQVDIYVQLFKLLDDDDRTIVLIGGTIDLDHPQENVKLYKLPELVKEWAEKRAENEGIDTGRDNAPAEGFTPVESKKSQK